MNNIDKFNYWCHKILPLVYDESLSYYEFLCKVIAKLNEIITETNEQTETINNWVDTASGAAESANTAANAANEAAQKALDAAVVPQEAADAANAAAARAETATTNAVNATTAANNAATVADTATNSANTARDAANAAAEKADTATTNANTAKNAATEAANRANNSAQAADSAADKALNAAVVPQEAADAANAAAARAETATTNAVNATTDANNAAIAANKAATASNDAAAVANSATSNANAAAEAARDAETIAISAAGDAAEATNAANRAATAANSAANAANIAATAATTAADSANTAATAANGAATAATTAADSANSAATAANAAATAATTAADSANSAATAANAAAENLLVTAYGVRFDGAENTGDTVHRLYNAVGLVAGVGTDTEKPQNDFDNIYPWSARRRCCGYWDVNGNFVVNAYKGEPGYTEDGSNGEVWVEHSLFYYKHDYMENGGEQIVISATPLAGFEPAPIFKGENDTVHMKGYTSAYPMATVDGKATSRSGVFCGLYSLNSAIEAARTLGNDYTVAQVAEWYTECLYMWVEFATRDLQSVMRGASNMPYSTSDAAITTETQTNNIVVSSATANKYVVGQTIGIGTWLGTTNVANNRIITAITDSGADKAMSFDGDPVDITAGNIVFGLAWKNGSCNSVIASSGSPVSNTNGRYNCVYRGKETPYGNAFEWISDVLFKRNGEGTAESPYTYDIYYLPDARKYANGTITDDYVKLNYQLPAADGYVSKLGLDDRFPWVRVPCEVKAGETTYYSDYYNFPRYAVSAAHVNGNWFNGSRDGPVCWHCSDAPSDRWVGNHTLLSHRR